MDPEGGPDEHPFESRLVEDEDARAMPQSQVLDSMLYTDKTIPEFDEQDYTSHRNVYVAVHVPRKSSKHRHRSKKRRSTQGHHSRNHSLNETPDNHGNEYGYQGEVPDNDGQITSVESTGPDSQDPVLFQHKALHGTVSDATPSSSRRSSLNGRPRYHKSHSLGAEMQRQTELNIPEVIREPRTPCDPCDRVKFLIGAEDADSAGCHDPTVHTIFTELEELKYDEHDHAKMEWKETARWVKFEEDVEEGGNKWSKPHVATLSLHSLFELRSCLIKGTVILDMRADNLAQISDYVLDNLVCTGQLEEDNREKVRSALLQRHKHLNSRKESENKILESIRSLGDIGRLNSKQGGDAADVVSNNSHRFGSFTKSMSNVPSLAGSRVNSRRGSMHVPGTNLTDGDGGGSGSLNRLEEEGTHDSEQDLSHLKKSTANFMKKIPPGSEASNVLVGEVDFLSHSIIAFVRLSEGRVLGDLTEVPIPTRFLFILLGPTGNQERYHEIGRSIATLMSDEVFHEVAYRARNRGDLLAGIDEFLDKVTVLPPGEWDPQIRLEPPSKIPSQEERKQSKAPRKKSMMSLRGDDERTPPIKWSKIPFLGLKDDLLRCYSFYRSDLSDALNIQLLSSLILIYFANIAIAFVFGAFFSDMTQGAMGATEMMLATAIGNFIFSIFSGQPLIILGATGTTVIFERIIFTICNSINIPFLEFRFWIGLYTSLFIIALVGLNSSAVMKLFTRFTGEIFSALISFVFMFEALRALWGIHLNYPYNGWILRRSIRRQCDCYQFPDSESLESTNLSNATRLGSYWDNPESFCSLVSLRKFVGQACPGNLFENHDVFLMSVILFFGTFLICFYLKKFRNSKFFRTIIRRIVSEFGVFISVVIWICVDLLADVDTPKLEVPDVFTDRLFTSENRTYLFIHPLGNGLPHWAIAAALIPALLATILLFVDQHITALIVNKKDNKLKKGPGYHVDMFLVGVMIFFHSVMGLPWVVGSTILSISHVQSLHIYGSSGPPGEPPKFLGVREQRVTLFFMSVLVGLSVMLYSVVNFVPLPVLYGLLFYLGVASLYGVQLLQRFKLLFIPNKYKPDYAYLRRVPNVRIHIFTIIQVVLLVLLVIVQGVDVLRVVFPVFVIALMFIRWLLGFCFSPKDLEVLDDPLPQRLYCKKCEGGHCQKRGYEVTLEEGSSNSDEVAGPENVVTEEPLASDSNLSPQQTTTRHRRSSEFNITQEVDKCDIWRSMVKDLDVPYSSPRRAARYDGSKPSITVTNMERPEDLDSPFDGSPEEQVPLEPLDSAQLDREESTARMLLEQGGSSGRSRACRKLFTSTEV